MAPQLTFAHIHSHSHRVLLLLRRKTTKLPAKWCSIGKAKCTNGCEENDKHKTTKQAQERTRWKKRREEPFLASWIRPQEQRRWSPEGFSKHQCL